MRYCAFADPGQVRVGAVGAMDIEEASEFFRNTSTNYSSSSRCRKPFPLWLLEILARDRGCRGVHTSHCLNIAVTVTKVECTFFDESWS